jgi:hypothetical protein
MTHKYQFVLDRQLMGVGMWSLGMDGPNHDIWDVLAVYFGDSSTVLLTPKAPTLAFIRDSSDASEGRVHVRWFSNVEPYLGGYRLHISTDPFVFGSAPLLDETALDKNSNTALVTGLELDSTYYFRLAAVDTSRTKISDTSDTYGVRTGGGQRYLVVDGFDRFNASYNAAQHNFNAYYGDPIAASLRHFDSADNDAVIDSLISLTGYEGGGKLFVTGSEIGWDLDRLGSPNNNPAFYNGYLKAIFDGDRADGFSFSGIGGSIFEGVSGTFGEVYDEDWPDYIVATGGSASALRYSTTPSQIAAIQYAGTFGVGTVPGKLVNIGFAIETIASSATRNALMGRILAFFEGVVSVDEAEGLPRKFALLQNYPNPFNPTTTIMFEVPAGVTIPTKLIVYDLLGRKLRTLVNEMKSSGQHSVSFDASGLASGVYVYRLESGDVSLSRKMLLLK